MYTCNRKCCCKVSREIWLKDKSRIEFEKDIFFGGIFEWRKMFNSPIIFCMSKPRKILFEFRYKTKKEIGFLETWGQYFQRTKFSFCKESCHNFLWLFTWTLTIYDEKLWIPSLGLPGEGNLAEYSADGLWLVLPLLNLFKNVIEVQNASKR